MENNPENIRSLMQLKDKLSDMIPKVMENISFRKTLEKFQARLSDTETRLVRRYQEYVDVKERFQNELNDPNYTGEPIELYGKELDRVTDSFVKENALFVTILTESMVEIIGEYNDINTGNKLDEPIINTSFPPPEEPELVAEPAEPKSLFDELISDEVPNENPKGI